MAKFKDTDGREWNAKLTVWHLEQVTERIGANLDDLLEDDGKGVMDLFRSSSKVARTLWVLIEEDAKKLDEPVKEDVFLRALAGEEFELARHALYRAVADFYLPRSWKKIKALGQNILDQTAIDEDSSSSVTGSPESSESHQPD